MPESPGDADMPTRSTLEDPLVRSARRAHERWVTVQRLWAAMDRLDIVDHAERVRFVCRALWPSMSNEVVERLARRAGAADALPTWRLRRPATPDEAVGRAAADLIRRHTLAD